jgi:hypothetical protein
VKGKKKTQKKMKRKRCFDPQSQMRMVSATPKGYGDGSVTFKTGIKPPPWLKLG